MVRESYFPIYIRKTTIKSDFEPLNKECKIIEVVDRHEFIIFLLRKRFLQIDSLARTDPKNYFKKIVSVHEVDYVEFTNHMTLKNPTIYEWVTNGGSVVYIIPSLHIVFTTQNNNCYVVEIPIEKIFNAF